MRYLTEGKEKSFEECARFVEGLFESHVEMVIQLFVLGNIIAYFIKKDHIQKSTISRIAYGNTVELDWNRGWRRRDEWLHT